MLAGGAGILIAELCLPQTFITPSTSRPRDLTLIVALAFMGFGIGILLLETAIWFVTRSYSRKIESKKAVLINEPRERLAEPHASRELPRESNATSHNTSLVRDRPRLKSKSEMPKTYRHTNDTISHSENARRQAEERRNGKARSLVTPIAALIFLAIGCAGYVAVKYASKPSGSVANGNQADGSNDRNQKAQQDAINKAIDKKPVALRSSLQQYSRISDDINRILRDGLEDKNIGGAIAVAVTNWQFNAANGIFKRPEELGFQIISNNEALVRRALRNEVRINEVQLKPLSDRQFRIIIKATNLTAHPLTCSVPKGQVFEIKDAYLSIDQKSLKSKNTQYLQGIANSNGGVYIIPPRDDGTIELIGFCINKGLSSPDGLGNITVYELKDKSFENPDGLHDSLRRINAA